MIALFEISAFAIIGLNAKEGFDIQAMVMAGAAVGMLIFQYTVLTIFFPNCDRYVLIIANFLAAVGLIIQYRASR